MSSPIESCRPAILENIEKSRNRGKVPRYFRREGRAWRNLSFRCNLKTGAEETRRKYSTERNPMRFLETFPAVISRDEKPRSNVLLSRIARCRFDIAANPGGNHGASSPRQASFFRSGKSVLWTIKRLLVGASGHGSGDANLREVTGDTIGEQAAETRPQHVVLKRRGECVNGNRASSRAISSGRTAEEAHCALESAWMANAKRSFCAIRYCKFAV